MSKLYRHVLLFNSILLIWFSFDMIGITIKDRVLVNKSWKEDIIFFIILILVELIFLIKKEMGKYVLLIWLFMWIATQFYFHWWVTLIGPWESKISYFSNTIKLINSQVRYIPDLYHIILHILILLALVNTIIYVDKSREVSV